MPHFEKWFYRIAQSSILLLRRLALVVGDLQCDQMARVFVQFLVIYNDEHFTEKQKICQSHSNLLHNAK